MTREQLETQLTEMWDAVSRITGDEAHEAIEQAYLTEDKMRKEFDDQEKIRDAAPDLLEALEQLKLAFVVAVGDQSPFAKVALGFAESAIKKARGL